MCGKLNSPPKLKPVPKDMFWQLITLQLQSRCLPRLINHEPTFYAMQILQPLCAAWDSES